jgi:hypothetical protein
VSSNVVERGSARLRLVRTATAVTGLWKWSILPLGVLYLILVVTHFGNMLANLYGSADIASAPVIGELYAQRAGSTILLGNLPWYSTLIFELATKWLPAHRQIWEVGPYAFSLIAVALMAWAAWRVAGLWAATVTSVLLVCASPPVFDLTLWLHDHTATWYSLALLGAFLVLITERRARLGWLPLAILTLAVGVIVGINAASDEELLISGLAPLLTAGSATWFLYPSVRTAKTAGLATAAAAIAGISALATTSIMHSGGVFLAYHQLKLASLETVPTNFKLWWQSIALLGNGNFSSEPITFTTVLALSSAILGVAATLLIPRFAWRYIREQRTDGSANPCLSAYLLFWASSAIFLSAGFILSTAPVGTSTVRYLVGIVYAVAAVVPLFALRGVAAQAAVVAGTLVFSLTSIKAFTNNELIKTPPQGSTQGATSKVAEDVAQVAESSNATRGYALYWDAAPITWRSHFRVQVYPLIGCAYPTGICPGPLNYIRGWYRPYPLAHTFLLTDSAGPPWSPPAALGPASATYRFGTVTMYVYNYDIATDIG